MYTVASQRKGRGVALEFVAVCGRQFVCFGVILCTF